MQVTEVREQQTVGNPHGVEVRKVHDTAHAQVMHITLQPGQSLKRHSTPVDVFFYVLEGTGVVEVGDEKRLVSSDVLIDSPARIPHGWYNESDTVLRVLVVKTPRPTEGTRLL